jgi:hypothetical protein
VTDYKPRNTDIDRIMEPFSENAHMEFEIDTDAEDVEKAARKIVKELGRRDDPDDKKIFQEYQYNQFCLLLKSDS